MGGNREELAVWQLHPGRCGREEGGAQPRPLVTRCHLLLPRRRLAQTMAARWRGGPGQPQSLASADTYCPRPTLRLPKPGAFYWGHPLAWPQHHLLHIPPYYRQSPLTFQYVILAAPPAFPAFLLAPPPISEPVSQCVLTTEWAVCGVTGTPILWPRGKCLIPRALIFDAVR